jgi:CheY-like chemotaxis protein
VALTVSDDGAGMSPGVLRRAGEPFFTTKPKGSGTGLGLATVREFARAHGGDMTIKSSAGAGASVRLYLRRAPVAEEDVSFPEAPRDPGAHGGASLLLVEDDASIRRHIAAALQILNYRVTQADNAAVARVLFEQAEGFDLAILGLQIGGEPGVRLAEQLREQKPALPVIFIMGATETKTSTNELVFRRPISEALLAQAILEKLGRSPPSIVNVETLRLSERVREKIHDPQMRSVFDIWKQAATRTARVPPTALVAEMRARTHPNACLIRINSRELQEFEVVFAGSALEERLGRPLAGEMLQVSEGESPVSIARAYNRCVRGLAYFDYARFGVRNGSRLLFERLCLPLSTDGAEVDHIFSVARFEEADAEF